jgi:hypothetical protein
VGRQRLVERGHRFRRQLRQTPAHIAERVGGHDADAAAVADDGEAIACRWPRGGEDFRRREQLAQRVHAQHAGAAEHGVVHGVVAGECAGVRGRRPRRRQAAPGLDHHHRLHARRGARRRHELARVHHRFHVQQDGVGVRVAGQVIEHVAKVDVRHVAQRHHVRETHAARLRPVDDGRDDRARLRHEGEPPAPRRQVREAGVEAMPRHHDADAVRPHDAQQMRLGSVEQRLLQARAMGVAVFLEARRNDDRRPGAAGAQLRHELRHRARRRGDDGQIRRQRQARHVLVGEHALHRHVFGVHRHHRPAEAAAEQVARDHRADRARPVAGADQRDRLRLEQVIEVADGHGDGDGEEAGRC